MKRWALAALLVAGCAADQGLEVSYAPVYCDQKPENPRCVTRALPPSVVASAAPVNICEPKPLAEGCPARIEADRREAQALEEARSQPPPEPFQAAPLMGEPAPVPHHHSRAPSGGGTVQVRSYTRRNGTVVHGYTRRRR